MRRNSKVIRSLDGGETWEVFKKKPLLKKTHTIAIDKDGKVVVVRLAK